MRILYVIHQFYPEFHSGTEKFLLNLASSVQKNGHWVQVVTYTYSEEDRGGTSHNNLFIRKYRYQGLPVVALQHVHYPLDLQTSFNNADVYRFAVNFLQDGESYDFVHIAHPMRLTSFVDAALKLGIPYGITLTDFWMLCPHINLQSSSGYLCAGPEGGRTCEKLCSMMTPEKIRERLERSREILSEAAIIASPSKFLAAVFAKEFSNLKPHIIPHGMNFKYIRANSKKYSDRDSLEFAYCGTLAPHKGVHLLLEAFLKLNPANAKLKLYGDSFHERDYFAYLRKLAGDDPRIQFCGTFSNAQVGDVFAGIDVLVLPSLCYENYPLALHEALACNVPVVASNIGGMAEKVENGRNGYTFQFGSVDGLMQKLKLIADNPEMLNSLKESMEGAMLPPVEEEAYLYERRYRAAISSRE